MEGDSFLLSVRTVGIMHPASEVKRPLETKGLSGRVETDYRLILLSCSAGSGVFETELVIVFQSFNGFLSDSEPDTLENPAAS